MLQLCSNPTSLSAANENSTQVVSYAISSLGPFRVGVCMGDYGIQLLFTYHCTSPTNEVHIYQKNIILMATKISCTILIIILKHGSYE